MRPWMRTLSTALLSLSLVACQQHHTFGVPDEPDEEACLTTKSTQFVRPVDVLFVVDNSGSMREEQDALRAQIPRMLKAFASGDLNDDGIPEHPRVTDLHVGVVSTDMGLPGLWGREDLGCGDDITTRYGDDGRLLLRVDPNVTSCSGLPVQDAPFVTWQASTHTDKDGGDDGVDVLAEEVACLAVLGTTGCGFEQPLEAALKALWPSDNMVNGKPVQLDRPFLENTLGHGAPDGFNAGFLRNEPGAESIIVVVLLTDENDCSSHDLHHFLPADRLPDGDVLKDIPLNLRCLGVPDELFGVSRYVDGLKALRKGHEDLVVFAAVAGVPRELIDRNVDLSDAAAVDGYYATMLGAPPMQEVADPSSGPNQMLAPSCVRAIPNGSGEPLLQKAYPPRRIVEVARGFGRNGVIESICQDDFTGVADTLLKRVFDTLERSSCTTTM